MPSSSPSSSSLLLLVPPEDRFDCTYYTTTTRRSSSSSKQRRFWNKLTQRFRRRCRHGGGDLVQCASAAVLTPPPLEEVDRTLPRNDPDDIPQDDDMTVAPHHDFHHEMAGLCHMMNQLEQEIERTSRTALVSQPSSSRGRRRQEQHEEHVTTLHTYYEAAKSTIPRLTQIQQELTDLEKALDELEAWNAKRFPDRPSHPKRAGDKDTIKTSFSVAAPPLEEEEEERSLEREQASEAKKNGKFPFFFADMWAPRHRLRTHVVPESTVVVAAADQEPEIGTDTDQEQESQNTAAHVAMMMRAKQFLQGMNRQAKKEEQEQEDTVSSSDSNRPKFPHHAWSPVTPTAETKQAKSELTDTSTPTNVTSSNSLLETKMDQEWKALQKLNTDGPQYISSSSPQPNASQTLAPNQESDDNTQDKEDHFSLKELAQQWVATRDAAQEDGQEEDDDESRQTAKVPSVTTTSRTTTVPKVSHKPLTMGAVKSSSSSRIGGKPIPAANTHMPASTGTMMTTTATKKRVVVGRRKVVVGSTTTTTTTSTVSSPSMQHSKRVPIRSMASTTRTPTKDSNQQNPFVGRLSTTSSIEVTNGATVPSGDTPPPSAIDQDDEMDKENTQEKPQRVLKRYLTKRKQQQPEESTTL